MIVIKADVYYKYQEGKMIIHFLYPQEYYIIINNKGETKIYLPSINKVQIMQNWLFSSENDVMFNFLNNQISDMGLQSQGFSLLTTKMDKNLMITTWTPPVQMSQKVSKTELVLDNYLPTFMGFWDQNGKMALKTYYLDYTVIDDITLPQRIIDIEYVANGDSVVSKKEYSNFMTGKDANSSYFNFTIPSNAQIQ